MNIKEGDIVQLVSGGPLMSVRCVSANSTLKIRVFVTWFTVNFEQRESEFYSTILKVVKDE